MTSRTLARLAGSTVAVLLGTALALPLAGVASAAPALDKDCKDFASQAAAQAYFRANGNRDRLDLDGDGIACENHEYASGGSGAPQRGDGGSTVPASNGGQVGVAPSGSVDAGDGSAAGPAPESEAAGFVLAGFGAVAAAGAAAAVRGGRRPARRDR